MTNQQNIDTEPAVENKPHGNWNGWDVFFIVAPLICIVLVPLGGLGYIRGRFYFSVSFYRDSFYIYIAIGYFIIFSVIYGFIRFFVYWKKHTLKKRFIIGIEIGMPILFVLLFIVPLFMPFETFFSPSCKPFMYGFGDEIESRADISAIRDWLKTLDEEDLTYYNQYSHYNELPESVRAIGGIIVFSTDRNGNPILHCSFGGGFDHWGVEIGAEDMSISPSDYVSRAGYRMYVEPGFYIVGW
jgi:hypothetical protein